MHEKITLLAGHGKGRIRGDRVRHLEMTTTREPTTKPLKVAIDDAQRRLKSFQNIQSTALLLRSATSPPVRFTRSSRRLVLERYGLAPN